MRLFSSCITACVLFCSTYLATAQDSPTFYDFIRGDLVWHTIETEHFKVHYHDGIVGGGDRSAKRIAMIAEDVYGPLTELYRHEPDTKVSIVLRDFEDYSNGAAYFFDNMIMLWAPALDTPLRGSHDWLRNVVAHEFTHIVQVQRAMKGSRRLPFQYFQLLTYEDVRRPDVLYGYPNGIVTYPVPVLSNPAWLAEGTAQYQRTSWTYDSWDSHRDMMLRTRVLAGKELSLREMGGFYSLNSLEREAVYNQGYALTQFLANEYGEEALRDVTEALGSWKRWSFDQAARSSLGASGSNVFGSWIGGLREEYMAATHDVRENGVYGRVVESAGFLNLHPVFSPDGSRFAYLSNKGGDYSRTALYVATGDTSGVLVSETVSVSRGAPTYTCRLGHRVTAATYETFAWSPDGRKLAYAKRRDTKKGYWFADLYEYDVETREERRITHDRRAHSPAYHPSDSTIVFLSEIDGTVNLYRLDLTVPDAVSQITAFTKGEQIDAPAWSANGSLFATMTGPSGLRIVRIDPSSGVVSTVVDSEADERHPALDPSGGVLYFSSDRGGISNIYRVRLDDADRWERLTGVLGGAFMPSVNKQGSMLFARYDWDGYKIARIDTLKTLPAEDSAYSAPSSLSKWTGRIDQSYHGSGVRTPPTAQSQSIDDTPASNAPDAQGYKSDFTSFSFFPVLRLDQYVSRRRGSAEIRLPDRTRGETLLRNTKLGFYLASREVLDGLSLLAGFLVGPASGDAESAGDFFAPSNLLDLERDLFVSFDYRKGVFLRGKRWSPQFSLQLFNVRRNVESGLAIEELACTACFPPDTTLADLSYNLWELDVIARSKFSRNLVVEASYRFSPYRVTTERFFSTELQQTIPASSVRYYIGRALRLRAFFEALVPHRHADAVMDGIKAEVAYEFEPGKLLDRFDVEDGVLSPRYNSFRNHRLTADIRYGRRLWRRAGASHGVSLRVRASTLLGGPVDNFFDDYVGGLIGARGYPFYALGGNETLWFQASYHLPLVPRINRQLWFVYADKLYARLYADAAFAWSGAFPGFDEARRDVGAELRLGLGSFYLLPTAVFVSATYGLDAFDVQLDADFVTPDGKNTVSYGKELQWHFGVLFGFDL